MAGILRHFPEKFDLDMDINGWVSIRELSTAIARKDRRKHWLRDRHIEAIVNTDPKGRYEVRGGSVRATYAHTVEIELDLPTENIPELLYYPCAPDELDVHLEAGISPGSRKWVHLSKTITTAANAGHVHHHRPVILEIDTIQMQANGDIIYHAGTTVYLTESVDGTYCALIEENNVEYDLMLKQWAEEEE
jgi:putative RNA 2'-phosphotransferase